MKINRPQSPCNEKLDYKIGHCIEKSIVARAGCQPYWSKYQVDGMPFCNTAKMLEHYGTINLEFAWMHRNELMSATKCLMPCSFMEYKVGLNLSAQNNHTPTPFY